MGPINYRPLKELENLGHILEPPKHRTSVATIRVTIPAQLRAVEKLLEPKSMGLPDTAYTGPKLAEDPRYRISNGTSQLAKTVRFLSDQILEQRELSSWRDRISRESPRNCFGQKRWYIYYQARN